MLEYKRDWERISTKAEQVEREWKDSLAKLSELEACWSTVSSYPQIVYPAAFLFLTIWLLSHPLDAIFRFTQLVNELRGAVGTDQNDVDMANGHIGKSLALAQRLTVAFLTRMSIPPPAIRRK